MTTENLDGRKPNHVVDPNLQIGDAVTEQARHDELLKTVQAESAAERNAFLNNGGGFVGTIKRFCGNCLKR